MTREWLLAAMALLSPRLDHDERELADALARTLAHAPPIFRDDEDLRRTAAFAIAVAFRESSFRLGAVGDQGRSFCWFQVHTSSGGGRELLADPDACVRKGLELLRTSARVCPTAPVAWFAVGGPPAFACANAHALRISRDRMSIALRLVRDMQKGDDP